MGLAVSDKKVFYVFRIRAYVIRGRCHFWPQGHNLNKLGRSSNVVATCQISWLKVLCFQTRRFFVFSKQTFKENVKIRTGLFGQHGHNLNHLVKKHYVMVHTKYPVCGPSGFTQDDFYVFLI